MNLPQTGGCQCGKIRYEITQQTLPGHSAFTAGMALPAPQPTLPMTGSNGEVGWKADIRTGAGTAVRKSRFLQQRGAVPSSTNAPCLDCSTGLR